MIKFKKIFRIQKDLIVRKWVLGRGKLRVGRGKGEGRGRNNKKDLL